MIGGFAILIGGFAIMIGGFAIFIGGFWEVAGKGLDINLFSLFEWIGDIRFQKSTGGRVVAFIGGRMVVVFGVHVVVILGITAVAFLDGRGEEEGDGGDKTDGFVHLIMEVRGPELSSVGSFS